MSSRMHAEKGKSKARGFGVGPLSGTIENTEKTGESLQATMRRPSQVAYRWMTSKAKLKTE